MTDTTNRPPLWREIDDAWWSLVNTGDLHAAPPESDQAACVIRAVRDWIFLGGRPDPVGVSADCLAIWDELTTEADRAEKGDG